MSEDRETRTDEDVEAHRFKAEPVGKNKLANDEGDGDDVEAHKFKARNKARNDEGEGDDVEGHLFKAAPAAKHKA
jgi:hypothetical protein